MAKLKLKHLESYLQDVDDFENPKVNLEQYLTTPHIAAHMLHTIESRFGDISDKMVADLGCGTGMLCIGSVMLGASCCIGVDIDREALETCRCNINDNDIVNIDLVQMDVRKQLEIDNHPWNKMFDTVIMNPPFGTRDEGADSDFLTFGLNISRSSVYSLHKTSTVRHFVKLAESRCVSLEEVAELKFELPKTYTFHRSMSKDISVTVLRFTHPEPGQKPRPIVLPIAQEQSAKSRRPKQRTTKR